MTALWMQIVVRSSCTLATVFRSRKPARKVERAPRSLLGKEKSCCQIELQSTADRKALDCRYCEQFVFCTSFLALTL